jgi:hypothetical protein
MNDDPIRIIMGQLQRIEQKVDFIKSALVWGSWA